MSKLCLDIGEMNKKHKLEVIFHERGEPVYFLDSKVFIAINVYSNNTRLLK